MDLLVQVLDVLILDTAEWGVWVGTEGARVWSLLVLSSEVHLDSGLVATGVTEVPSESASFLEGSAR